LVESLKTESHAKILKSIIIILH